MIFYEATLFLKGKEKNGSHTINKLLCLNFCWPNHWLLIYGRKLLELPWRLVWYTIQSIGIFTLCGLLQNTTSWFHCLKLQLACFLKHIYMCVCVCVWEREREREREIESTNGCSSVSFATLCPFPFFFYHCWSCAHELMDNVEYSLNNISSWEVFLVHYVLDSNSMHA